MSIDNDFVDEVSTVKTKFEELKLESTLKTQVSDPHLMKKKQKYTEFSYLLQRKTFRMMRKFFKDSFEAHHGKRLKFKQAVKKMSSSEMFKLS